MRRPTVIPAVALVGALLAASPIAHADPPASAPSEVLVLTVSGETYRGVVVEEVPGDHLTLSLSSGGTQRIPWDQIRSPSAATPASAPAPESTTPTKPKKRGKGMKVAGYVTLGTGLGLGATGAIMMALAADSQRQADTMCSSSSYCTAAGLEETNNAKVLRTYGAVMLVIGGAAAVTGVALLIAAPSNTQTVTAYVGPGSAGLSGTF